jgi:hypothetical protein
MLGAAQRLADGRGLALDRQGGGEYVGWAVYATADFDDGEPERLSDVTVAEAVDLAPERRGLIVTATLDAIAVLRLPDEAGQLASEAVPRQSERLVDELVEAGLPRDTVLSLARRLSRAHVVARDLGGHPARETPANDTDPARYRSPRFGERYRLEQRLLNLEAKLHHTRDRLARLPPEYDTRFESEEQLHAVPKREPRRGWLSVPPRLAAAGALVLVAVVGLLILVSIEGSRPKRQSASTEPSSSISAPTRAPQAEHASTAQRTRPPTVPVNLSAIGAWDPYGDGREHDTKASAAEDGNAGTYWPTETYVDGLQKPGVGLLLDAGRAVHLRRLVVTTDTPGYSALIEAGSASAGPFRPISRARTVATTTAFSLRARAERYYLIWITRLEHTAHVNEVRAFGFSAKT